MQTVVLVVHLILALLLILVVLLQRSEGGGLGMGGGGGGGGAMTGRAAANALTKATWIVAVGFLITSLSLTIIAAQNAQKDSVLERLGTDTAPAPAPALPGLDGNLLPPAATDGPALPPKAE
jgi:preprotein translocase subunit SecG